jgi:spoIIIJ-associated protein
MAKKLIKSKLDDILKLLDISPEVTIEEDEETYKVVVEGNDLSFLIGYRGESLQALQTLLSTMVFNESNEWVHIVVDINGYRDSRREKIEEMTRSFIDRVRFHNSEIEMPTMNSYERRQVHMFVSDYPDISSESAGEGRNRRVVLSLKKEA